MSFIIIGDFNCHVGKGDNDRAWGKTCSNGAKLLTLLDSYNMTIADLDNNSIGPTYTFLKTMGDLSYIDHCVLSQRLVNDIIHCSILDDCTRNTSDHLPVSLSIKMTLALNPSSKKHRGNNIKWHQLTPQDIETRYTVLLEQSMYDYIMKNAQHLGEIQRWAEIDVDQCLSDIYKMMNTAGNKSPRPKFKNNKKSYWSRELNVLFKLKKKAWREWVAASRPRDATNVLWIKYKECKKTLRCRQRQEQYNYELNYITKIEEAEKIDQKLLAACEKKN